MVLKFDEATKKNVITYCKIHIPWDLLTSYAEELNFRVPINVSFRKSEI